MRDAFPMCFVPFDQSGVDMPDALYVLAPKWAGALLRIIEFTSRGKFDSLTIVSTKIRALMPWQKVMQGEPRDSLAAKNAECLSDIREELFYHVVNLGDEWDRFCFNFGIARVVNFVQFAEVWQVLQHKRVAFQSTTHGFLVKPHEVVVSRLFAAALYSRREKKKGIDRKFNSVRH